MSSERESLDSAQDLSLPKFTRYHSVRNAQRLARGAQSATSPTSRAAPSPHVRNDSLSRSMSRYHRRSTQVDPASPVSSTPPNLARRNLHHHSTSLAALTGQRYSVHDFERKSSSERLRNPSPDEPLSENNTLHRQTYDASRNIEDALQQVGRKQKSAKLTAEEEIGERLRTGLDQKHGANITEIAAPVVEGRQSEKLEATNTNQDTPERVLQSSLRKGGHGEDPTPDVQPPRTPLKANPEAITPFPRLNDTPEHPRKGTLDTPGSDRKFNAPVPAVNRSQRLITLVHKFSSAALPVFHTTTAKDLLNSASACIDKDINSSNSFVVEDFKKLGLERPLRQYERILDVMNSWDSDTQNTLKVISSSSQENGGVNLMPTGVPMEQPSSVTLSMYYFQNSERWDKQYITLKFDGQIFVAKRKDGCDSVDICNLSDSDIYTPTREQAKKIKSPRKYCFAIKSQQKSIASPTGAISVYFFATSDRSLANKWYKAVQEWRSWYLFNVLDRAQHDKGSSITPQESLDTEDFDSDFESKPLGLYSPKRLEPRPGQLSPEQKSIYHSRQQSRQMRAPPSSYPNRLAAQESRSAGAPSPEKNWFAASDFQRNPSLNTPSKLERSPSIKSGTTTRQIPKPLVDLTAPPPRKRSTGSAIAPLPGRPLVDLANDTSTVQGTTAAAAASSPTQSSFRHALHHRRQQQSTSTTANSFAPASVYGTEAAAALDDSAEDGFTGGGLLGRTLSTRSKRTQGGLGHGFGVRTGDRTQIGQPLVQLQQPSQFVEGSLLKMVEQYKGDDAKGVIIDRKKRVEGWVGVGEGV